MPARAKICGIKTVEAIEVAAQFGAVMIGLVFVQSSPRFVPLSLAASLAKQTPRAIRKVGLFVDASDRELEQTIKFCELDLLQLHGKESPSRVAQISGQFGLPVIKAIPIASSIDFENIPAYEETADWLLFDAKVANAPLPGGNATAFDWNLLEGRQFERPWILSGGLDPQNVRTAIEFTGAEWVDVSSGVEVTRGEKDPQLIKEFLLACR